MAVILPKDGPTMTIPPPPEIYCVKCKAHTESKDVEAVTMKNGRLATRATCVACGTKKTRFGTGG